jgi:hypothetical protein
MESTMFQSLSRVEAIQVHNKMSEDILHAFEVGANLILQNYDVPLEELFVAYRKALKEIGFGHIPIGDAMKMLNINMIREK